jgi:protein arginine kinase activator
MYLSTLLKKVHGSNHHLGKSPTKISQAERDKIGNFQDLKMQLQQAVQMEDFERAAEIRDKIRELENKEKDQQP